MRLKLLFVGIAMILAAIVGSSAALYASGSDPAAYVAVFLVAGLLFLIGIVVTILGAALKAPTITCPACGLPYPGGTSSCTWDGTPLVRSR